MGDGGAPAFATEEAAIAVARAFVANAVRPMVLLSRSHEVLLTNPAAGRLFPTEADLPVGGGLTRFVRESDRNAFVHALTTARATSTPRRCAVRFERPTVSRPTECSFIPVTTPTGTVVALIAEFTPAAERAETRANAIAAFTRAALASHSMQWLGEHAAEFVSTECDADAVTTFRVTTDECVLRPLASLPERWLKAPPESRRGSTLLALAARAGTPLLIDDLAREPDITPSAWLEDMHSAIVAPIRVGTTIIGGLLATARLPDTFTQDDLAFVTAVADVLRIAAERADEEPQGSDEATLARLGSGTWAWDPGTQQLYLSPVAMRLLGVDPQTFGGSTQELEPHVAAPGESPAQYLRIRFAELVARGSTLLRVRTADDTNRDVSLRGVLFNVSEPQGAWIGVASDVTQPTRRLKERQRVEAAIMALRNDPVGARAGVAGLLDDAPVGIGLWDAQFHCLSINDVLARILGTSASDAVGEPWAEHSPGIWRHLNDALRAVVETGVPTSGLQWREPTADTADRQWSLHVFPTHQRGVTTGFGVVATDITEQVRGRRIEELLHHASAAAATSTGDVEDDLTQLANLAIPMFADAALIAYTDPSTGTRQLVRATDADPHARREDAEPDETALRTTLTQLARTSRRERFLTDAERALLSDTLALDDGMVSTVGDGQAEVTLILGQLGAGDLRYTARDLALVSELGYRASDIVESGLLREDARRIRTRLEVLARLGELSASDIVSTTDLRTVADVLVPEYADAALLMVVEGAVLRRGSARADHPVADTWLRDEWRPVVPLSSDTPATRALRTGQTAVFTASDLEQHPDRYASILHDIAGALGMESGITIPVIGSEGPLGALFCVRTPGRRQFGAEDIAIAPELARRVAPLLQAGQQLQRARRHTEELQRSLLPERLPDVFGYEFAAHYRPAESELAVGGDWYDVLELPDRSVLIAIGDVVGHGAEAAGLTGQLRTAVRIAASESPEPGAILDRLDRFFAGFADHHMATALLLHLDRDAGAITWATAGHPTPLLRRADGTVRYLAGAASPPIGTQFIRTTPQHRDVLDPGACLLLFTDGLVERRGETIDDGLARFARLVADDFPETEALGDVLHPLVNTMLGDTNVQDDVAALVVRRAGAIAATALAIPNDPAAIRDARHHIGAFLSHQAVATESASDVLLVLSELCTNAIEHSGVPTDESIHIHCTVATDMIELTVEDVGAWAVDTPNTGGRGLHIVRTLSDRVDVTRSRPGTRVTIRLSTERTDGTDAAT